MKKTKRGFDWVVFFDEDTQHDFMSRSGKLYVKGAEKLIPNLKKITRLADSRGITIISSLDAHIKNDPEFRRFPRHCVVNTRGQRKISETMARRTRQRFINKRVIDSFSLGRTKRLVGDFAIAYVYGVATDYCVKAACLGLLRQGLKTYLVKDAVKPISRERGVQTLKMLKKRGVEFVSTKELIAKLR